MKFVPQLIDVIFSTSPLEFHSQTLFVIVRYTHQVSELYHCIDLVTKKEKKRKAIFIFSGLKGILFWVL